MVVDTMSASRLELYERCPESFMQRYVLGRRTPPGGAAAMGNAIDSLSNTLYLEKLQTHETPDAKECQDFFAAAFDSEAAKVHEWDTPDARDIYLDRGVAGVANWRDRCAQFVQPTREPQYPILMNVDSSDPEADESVGIAPRFKVIGRVDVIATIRAPKLQVESEVVIDQKASRKTYGSNDIYRSAQPPIYTGALGIPNFQFHNLRTDVVKPRVQVIRTSVPQGAVDHVVHRMELARRNIARGYHSGDWFPNRNNMLCSRRWCGFWEACERRHGGKVTD